MEQNFQHDHLQYENYKQISSSNRGSSMNTHDNRNYSCNLKQLQNHQYCLPSDHVTSASDNAADASNPSNSLEQVVCAHGQQQYNVHHYNSNSVAHFQHLASAVLNSAVGATCRNFHYPKCLNSDRDTLHQRRSASRVLLPTISHGTSFTSGTVNDTNYRFASPNTSNLDCSSSVLKPLAVSNLHTADFVNSSKNCRERGHSSTNQTSSSANSALDRGGRARKKGKERADTSLGRGQKNESQRLYPCNVCGQILRHRSSFITHQRSHRQEKFFKCNRCGKTFIDQSTVTKHLRTHSGVKPYTCSICQTSFSQSGNLRRHVKRLHAQS